MVSQTLHAFASFIRESFFNIYIFFFVPPTQVLSNSGAQLRCHPSSLARTLLMSFPMSRPIRYMPDPYTVFEVTTRTMQSRLLLKPSPELNSIILGIIGKALSMYNVQMYLFVFLSNHYHMLLSACDFCEL